MAAARLNGPGLRTSTVHGCRCCERLAQSIRTAVDILQAGDFRYFQQAGALYAPLGEQGFGGLDNPPAGCDCVLAQSVGSS